MTHVETYVRFAQHSEQTLADSLRTVGTGHAAQADIFHTCATLAAMSDSHLQALEPVAHRYEQQGDDGAQEPERLHAVGLEHTRTGEIGLLRDLQDLHLLATLVQSTWTLVAQAAQGLRDRELLHVAVTSSTDTSRQLSWLNTRMKAAAPQALIIES